MLYVWVKTLVGALLAANFSIPLVTVLTNRDLWDEPMALLAGNMSLTSTLFGIFVMLIGLYDVADLQSVALCRCLQYWSVGIGIAFKTAQTCAAVNQFVAVVYPLHHYPLMMRAKPWLFGATCLTFVAQVVFGLVAHFTDMTTFAEHVGNHGNNSTGNFTYTGCRWETAVSNVFTVFAEVQLIAFSFITASLLIYTGIIGHRMKVRLMREESQRLQNGTHGAGDEGRNKAFFENYRAFKSIVAVLSLTVIMDIVAPIMRISSRWHPRPKLNGFLHQLRLFGFIFEGWAYGLLNSKMRAAYKKMFCGKSDRGRVSPVYPSLREAALRRQQTLPSVAVLTLNH